MFRSFVILLVIFSAGLACAASGIKGRVAWQGQLVPGVKVSAYSRINDIPANRPVAVSAPVDVDGTYRLELAPGDYFLVARDFDGEPEPGNHFCYYSGAPVRVHADSFATVGFNLIKVPAEKPPAEGGPSGIEGEVTYQGEALERCYLYVYTDTSRAFKGPAYLIQPVEKGRFRLRLPPGEYWILARKRERGGRFGPIEIGDYFNFYYANPVRVDLGRMQDVSIETVTRLEMLEKDDAVAFRGLRGTVIDSADTPVAGMRVFGYRDAGMSGHPDVFSEPTGSDGRFELAVQENGPWFLVARQSFGGPAQGGEYYGRFAGGEGRGISLAGEKQTSEVQIRVEKKATH